MPDLTFGEDKSDYARRCIAWAREEGIGSMEVVRCVNIKWQAWEVQRLIDELDDGSKNPLHEAVILLLRHTFIP